MIYGLDIDKETESLIVKAFEGWGDHFKKKFREKGPEYLVNELKRMLESLQSPKKTVLVDDYRYYIQFRDALEIIQRIVPAEVWSKYKREVDNIDVWLRANWVAGPTCICSAGLSPDTHWWYFNGLPQGVVTRLNE